MAAPPAHIVSVVPSPRVARAAISGVFLVHGAVVGTFATRIPWIRDRLDLSPGSLGIALLVPALGALLAMSASGALVHRYDGRTVTRWLMAVWCLALVLPPLAPSLGALCLALLVFGGAGGMADVAMNTQAVQIEERDRRSIMSSLHGMWSVGGFAGSLVGVVAVRAGLDARAHLAGMAVVLLLCSQLAAARLPSAPP